MVKLTVKQENFIQGILKGLSQREAYKQAYTTSKMSNVVIDVKACEMLKKGKVQVRYEELRSRMLKELEDEGIIDAKKVMKEIASIAFDDIGNYLEYKTVQTKIKDDEVDGEPIIDYDTVIILKDSKTISTKNISELSKGKDGQFKFKLYCRDAALFKLAELIGIENFRASIGDGGVKFDFKR